MEEQTNSNNISSASDVYALIINDQEHTVFRSIVERLTTGKCGEKFYSLESKSDKKQGLPTSKELLDLTSSEPCWTKIQLDTKYYTFDDITLVSFPSISSANQWKKDLRPNAKLNNLSEPNIQAVFIRVDILDSNFPPDSIFFKSVRDALNLFRPEIKAILLNLEKSSSHSEFTDHDLEFQQMSVQKFCEAEKIELIELESVLFCGKYGEKESNKANEKNDNDEGMKVGCLLLDKGCVWGIDRVRELMEVGFSEHPDIRRKPNPVEQPSHKSYLRNLLQRELDDYQAPIESLKANAITNASTYKDENDPIVYSPCKQCNNTGTFYSRTSISTPVDENDYPDSEDEKAIMQMFDGIQLPMPILALNLSDHDENPNSVEIGTQQPPLPTFHDHASHIERTYPNDSVDTSVKNEISTTVTGEQLQASNSSSLSKKKKKKKNKQQQHATQSPTNEASTTDTTSLLNSNSSENRAAQPFLATDTSQAIVDNVAKESGRKINKFPTDNREAQSFIATDTLQAIIDNVTKEGGPQNMFPSENREAQTYLASDALQAIIDNVAKESGRQIRFQTCDPRNPEEVEATLLRAYAMKQSSSTVSTLLKQVMENSAAVNNENSTKSKTQLKNESPKQSNASEAILKKNKQCAKKLLKKEQ